MNKIIRLAGAAFLVSVMFLLCACSKNDSDSNGYRRVVILYLAANNNLSGYASGNIQSLKQGFVPKENSKDILLVYSHLLNAKPVLLRLYKDGAGNVQEDVVANFEMQNSASPDVLHNVLDKIPAYFPAKEYGLILWSHGTGWLPAGYYANPSGFNAYMQDPYAHLVKSFGEDTGKEMDIKDMCSAIPYHFSFIIFDCCLMGGIEIAYELKDKCDYILASPTEIMATSFPYSEIINPLFESTADLKEVGDIYYNYYNTQSGTSQSATLALYKSSMLQPVAAASKVIFNNNRSKIASLDLNKIQRYYRLNRHWFYDFSDFMKSIASDPEYSTFKGALDNAVIAKWNTANFIDIAINNFSGISTYIQNPQNSYLDNYYKGYKWNKDCGMVQ